MTGGDTRYPPGTVRALLSTPLVTSPTRDAIEGKLSLSAGGASEFFDAREFARLRAVCARLIPQSGPDTVDIAVRLDGRLARGDGDGWRYAMLPPDRDAYRRGLEGVEQTARALFLDSFIALAPADQEAVLRAVERGDPPGEAWRELSAYYWFEELLVEAAQIFYAHPFGQEEIGFVGMADAAGWTRIGLNELDAHEPRPIAGADAP